MALIKLLHREQELEDKSEAINKAIIDCDRIIDTYGLTPDAIKALRDVKEYHLERLKECLEELQVVKDDINLDLKNRILYKKGGTDV